LSPTASIIFSTSPSVRCSLVRRSAFLGLRGATVRFTVGGATNRSFGFAITNALPLDHYCSYMNLYMNKESSGVMGAFLDDQKPCNCGQRLATMVKQCNARFFEVLIGQFAEDREIDIVVCKC
jgi:hypothetical protein